MSPRHRLGVALLLDPPGSLEVDGLRRALGDTALGGCPGARDAGPSRQRPRRGPRPSPPGAEERRHRPGRPDSSRTWPGHDFHACEPVVYLAVGGPDLDPLARLRQAVVAGPMLRPDHWPWVPHVTLSDDAPADRIGAALAASVLLQGCDRL